MDNNEDEREDTLTNIRAVRAGVKSLFDARGQDQTRTGRLTKLAFGVVLVIFAVGMTAATHMSQGISEIREDQRLVHGDITKILLVTTNLAYEAQHAQVPPSIELPESTPPNTLGTQATPAP